MIKTKEEFIQSYSQVVEYVYGRPADACNEQELYTSLVIMIREMAMGIRRHPEEGSRAMGEKKVYYFSMEFLIGKLLENYLLCLGIRDIAADGLADMGIDFERICECEPDPGLGNGGLGRLAACFLESMAATGINGDGMGLRYHFGLFKQKIENGYQVELPDAWLDNGYPWEKPRKLNQ